MKLECLVVTCDPALFSHIQDEMGSHGTSLSFRQDSASAIELAARRHLDGVVIDCDDVPGGAAAIAQMRSSPANQHTLIFAVVNGVTSPEAALDLGANFVLTKPLQPLRLHSILDVAIPKMEREHRRYFRFAVDLPIEFKNPLGQPFTAKMKNVSEGGLAIKLLDPVRLQGVVIVEFELPSVDPRPFHAKADVVWSDSFVMGLRFLYIEKDSGAALQGWLSHLENQSHFRESAPRLN